MRGIIEKGLRTIARTGRRKWLSQRRDNPPAGRLLVCHDAVRAAAQAEHAQQKSASRVSRTFFSMEKFAPNACRRVRASSRNSREAQRSTARAMERASRGSLMI